MNKVFLLGRLGRDPEIKYTQSGTPVANFNVATTEYYSQNGERKEKTEWHRVVVWGKGAERVQNRLQKGSLVFIEGKLSTRKWEDSNGETRYTTEVVAWNFTVVSNGRPKEEQPSGGSGSSGGGIDFPDTAADMDEAPF